MPSKGMTWAEMQKTGLGELFAAMGLRKTHDRWCEGVYSVDARLKEVWSQCRCDERRLALPKLTVYKQLDEDLEHHKMWCGTCSCGKRWHFYFFGATLGFGLEHQRRCGR